MPKIFIVNTSERLRRHARKVIVGVMGFTILIFGAILLPTPLPLGWILIPLALIVLAGEFVFARRWLDAIQNNTGALGE
ncbi:MAG: PGPGW domain-containing protein, partial [Planctomycetota bacterium]